VGDLHGVRVEPRESESMRIADAKWSVHGTEWWKLCSSTPLLMFYRRMLDNSGGLKMSNGWMISSEAQRSFNPLA